MDNVTFSDTVMQEEIFGPVLPILTYDSISEAVNNIRAMSHPLALYIFAGDTHVAENVIARIGFGGGLHQRYTDSPCHKRNAFWRIWRKRHGQLPRKDRI